MLIPVVLLASMSALAAWRVRNRKPKGLTPQRRAVFEGALVTLKDPTKLRELADVYTKEGLTSEADILRKRAAIRELPKAIKLQRKAVFKKAINSKNPDAIRDVAAAFAGEGCFGAARDLNAHADSLLVDVIEEEIPEVDESEEESEEGEGVESTSEESEADYVTAGGIEANSPELEGSGTT
jgi:hypothetical protein